MFSKWAVALSLSLVLVEGPEGVDTDRVSDVELSRSGLCSSLWMRGSGCGVLGLGGNTARRWPVGEPWQLLLSARTCSDTVMGGMLRYDRLRSKTDGVKGLPVRESGVPWRDERRLSNTGDGGLSESAVASCEGEPLVN